MGHRETYKRRFEPFANLNHKAPSEDWWECADATPSPPHPQHTELLLQNSNWWLYISIRGFILILMDFQSGILAIAATEIPVHKCTTLSRIIYSSRVTCKYDLTNFGSLLEELQVCEHSHISDNGAKCKTNNHQTSKFAKHKQIIGPRQANLVLIAYASSEGSGEPAHPRSLARTFAARSYKQWIKRNLQTESQIPGPSEWLGMRSWNLSWRNTRRHKFACRGSYRLPKQLLFVI